MASKLIKCTSCGQEIASNAKNCPQCGGKNKKPIFKKWWFWLIIVIVIAPILANLGGGENTENRASNNAPATQSTNETVPPASSNNAVPPSETTTSTDVVKYRNGTYLVGNDIEAGLYRVVVTDTLMGMGYVERSKGVSMEFSDILANIILTGDGYVEIKETDVAVKLTGVEIFPINLEDLVPDIKSEVSDGIFLVGYDIAPGTYKVEVTDTIMEMGYVERTRNVAMDFSDIIANEIFQGQGYVEIRDSDFAIRVQGANLVMQ